MHHLKPGGHYLVKCIPGVGHPEYPRLVEAMFRSGTDTQARASRDRSNEIYLLGKGRKVDAPQVFGTASGWLLTACRIGFRMDFGLFRLCSSNKE